MVHQLPNGSMSAAQAFKLLDKMRSDTAPEHTPSKPVEVKTNLHDAVLAELSELIIKLLKLEPDDFSIKAPLSDYGLDSIAATEIGNIFTRDFGIAVPPTVFFEFQNLEGFIGYLLANHKAELTKKYEKLPLAGEKLADQNAPSPKRTPATAAATIALAPSRILSAVPNFTVSSTIAVDAEPLASEAPTSIEALWRNAEAASKPTPAPIAFAPSIDVHEPSKAVLDACQPDVDRMQLHRLARADGAIVEYSTYGSGTPVLMIGGLAMHPSVMWRLQLASIGSQYRLIMLHTPGAGASNFYPGMTLTTLADDIAAVLDHADVADRIPVVGYSFGGVLAQAFVLNHPERVSGICVCVSSPFAEGASNFKLLMSELQKSSSFMRLNRDWNIPILPNYAPLVSDFDFKRTLKNVCVPALVIAAAQDQYMKPSYSSEIANQIPKARVIEVADAGHLVGFTHHRIFNEHLLQFLGSLATVVPDVAAVRAASTSASVCSFKPTTDRTLQTLEMYVRNGEQGHCAILSSAGSRASYLLNIALTHGRSDKSGFNSYFLTSAEEAFDAALRLARHHARNRKGDSRGTILVIERSGRWQRHFDPLNSGLHDALVPGIIFANSLEEASRKLKSADTTELSAIAVCCDDGFATTDSDAIFEKLSTYGALTIAVEGMNYSQPWRAGAPQSKPDADIFVVGEGISDHQAPIGVCAVSKRIRNPWLMTPNESYVRHVMTNFGFTLEVACDHLIEVTHSLLSAQDHRVLLALNSDPAEIKRIHDEFGNTGYAKLAALHGFDGRFYEARGMSSRHFDGETTREITDCFLNVGTAPRGLNPKDVIDGVAKKHDRAHNYWSELASVFTAKTRLNHLIPTSSNVTAVEAALTVGLLAHPDRKKLVCFTGGAGFTLASAASSLDKVFDIFRKPFMPTYPHTVFLDPDDRDCARQLERELLSGTVALVWFETIQVDANASRPLPAHLIELINRHKQAGGYLVGVDETQTNLITGKLLHSDGLVHSPDIVALGSALCDSLVPVGAVLVGNSVIEAARTTSPARVMELLQRSSCQLSAHIALNSLNDIMQRNLIADARTMGTALKNRLIELADKHAFIREVRGEGCLLTVELDLTGQDPFVERSFGYLLWGTMMRDPVHGVAAAVCPIHNNCLRFLPSLTMTHADIDAIAENFDRALSKGISGVLADCAAHAKASGDERKANFFMNLAGQPSAPSTVRRIKMSNSTTRQHLEVVSFAPAATTTKQSIRPLREAGNKPTVCIVGAGVSGVSMAKALKQRGIPFDCFDKRDRIGGIWAYDPTKKHTSVWRGMNMNTPRGLYQFSDFPMPSDYPDYPAHQQTHAYLNSYVDHFGIRDDIHLNTGVAASTRLPDGTWRVTLDTGEVRDYDVLIAANGHHNEPNLPDYVSQPLPENAIHSKQYRSRHEYQDKTVLVVGVGNSGSQVAVDVSHDAKSTYLSLRRGVYVLPHYMFGLRMDKVMWELNSWWARKLLPYPLHGMLFTGLYNAFIAKRRQMGMPKPDHWMMASLPTLSENFANRIGDGKLKIVPEVKSIDGRHVTFVDGTKLEVDNVIYSTGYLTTFPFLDPKYQKSKDNHAPMFLRIFTPGVDNLLFIGLFQAITWGFLDMIEQQAIVAAEYLAGTYKLPPVAKQTEMVEKDAKIIRREFLATLRNNYEMHGPTYMHELDKELRRGADRARAAGYVLPIVPQRRVAHADAAE